MWPSRDHNAGFEQMGGARCCLAHHGLALLQVVLNGRIGAGELPAPVVTRLEQPRRAPAGQGALTDTELVAGLPGGGPRAVTGRFHRRDAGVPPWGWTGTRPLGFGCTGGYRGRPCPPLTAPLQTGPEQAQFRPDSDPLSRFLRTFCAQWPKKGIKKGPSKSSRTLLLESIGATGFEPAT